MHGHRIVRWLLGTLVAAGVLLLSLLGVSEAVAGQQQEHPELDTLVFTTADLPSGFAPYAPSTGPLDHAGLLRAGLSPAMADLATGYGRAWTSTPAGRAAAVVAMDLGNASRVDGFLRELASQRSTGATALGNAAGVPGSQRFRITTTPAGVQATSTYFGRGSVLVLVQDVGPASAGVATDDALVRAEADLVGRRYGAGGPEASAAADRVGQMLGALLGYLLVVEGVAFLRDPQRRDRRRSTGAPWPADAVAPGWVDVVDARAGSLRGAAIVVVAVQLAGLVMAAASVLPDSTGHRLVLLGIGVAACVLPTLRRRDRTRRRVRSLPWEAAAALTVVAGVGCLAASAVAGDDPGGGHYLTAAVMLFAAGAIAKRWGRRVASRTAQQLTERDTRPPVLFLRCFGDDRTKLRSATLGRRTLIEKLSPSRFDRFEEVLVRHVSARGPVIAINPPGTRLPPIGAARASLADDQWQGQVDTWLAQAALIVIVAPAAEVTEGLVWELRRVVDQHRWDRVVVVVPPVRRAEVRRRWLLLATAPVAGVWPFATPLPVDPAEVLALGWRGSGWQVACARARTEWTYAAALDEIASAAPAALTPA